MTATKLLNALIAVSAITLVAPTRTEVILAIAGNHFGAGKFFIS